MLHSKIRIKTEINRNIFEISLKFSEIKHTQFHGSEGKAPVKLYCILN